MGTKSILFAGKLSSTFTQVQENFESEFSGDDFASYEIEDPSKTIKFLKVIPCAICLVSDVQLCVQILSAHKENIRKNIVKVILSSDKNLPNKIVNKLIQHGLSEYVEQKTNLKSVIYKIKFLSRTLKSKEDLKKESTEDQVTILKSTKEDSVIVNDESVEIKKIEPKERVETPSDEENADYMNDSPTLFFDEGKGDKAKSSHSQSEVYLEESKRKSSEKEISFDGDVSDADSLKRKEIKEKTNVDDGKYKKYQPETSIDASLKKEAKTRKENISVEEKGDYKKLDQSISIDNKEDGKKKVESKEFEEESHYKELKEKKLAEKEARRKIEDAAFESAEKKRKEKKENIVLEEKKEKKKQVENYEMAPKKEKSKEVTVDYSVEKEEKAKGKRREEEKPEDEIKTKKPELDPSEYEISSPAIFDPKIRGLNYVIDILELYRSPILDSFVIFKYVSDILQKEVGAITLFFVKKSDSEEYEEIFNEERFNYDDELKKKWEKINIPEWEDHRFVNEKNQFIYPFYDGMNPLGYAVLFTSEHRVANERNAKIVELVLSTAKAMYLQKFYEFEQKSNETTIQKITGFLAKTYSFIKVNVKKYVKKTVDKIKKEVGIGDS